MAESCSIVVVGRDKFSPTGKCLDSIIANTPGANDIILVLGGVPKNICKDITERFGTKVQCIFKGEFLNPPQARNLGLRAVKTRLAILMDNDVVVHPGWLEPLLDCQKETGAVMVVPMVLEKENIIHTAGNSLYITHVNGKAFGYKELPLNGMILGEKTNLKRQPTDYGELHCQLVEVEPTLRLGAFDDNIREVGECDTGLTWAKAGHKMFFEPKSVVWFMLNHPIKAEDIQFFAWRWDMRGILKGYLHFEKKWNLDITEYGQFREFLLHYNKKLGFWARVYPSAFTLRLDSLISKISQTISQLADKIMAPWRRYLAWRIGYYEWPVFNQDFKKNQSSGYR